jgi:hypothetical protein
MCSDLSHTSHSCLRKAAFIFYANVFSFLNFLSMLPMPALLYAYYHLLVNTIVRKVKENADDYSSEVVLEIIGMAF